MVDADVDNSATADPLVAEFRVSHPNFPLMATVESTPDLTIRSQFQPGTSSTVPEKYFVVEADDFEALEATARNDPSVREVTLVTGSADRRTYRVTFTESTVLLSPKLVEIGVQIDGIDTAGDAWQFRIFAGDRQTMLAALDCASETCHEFTLDRLYSPVDEAGAEFVELTPTQRETLELAYRDGYFDVPRGTSLAALGDQLGVSDSAVSERLRNAIHALVEQTVPPPGEDGGSPHE